MGEPLLPGVRYVLYFLFVVYPREGVFPLQLLQFRVSDGLVPLGKPAEVCLYGVDGRINITPVPPRHGVYRREQTQPGDCDPVLIYVKGDNLCWRLFLGRQVEDEYRIPLIPSPLQKQRGRQLSLSTQNFPPIQPEPLWGFIQTSLLPPGRDSPSRTGATELMAFL